MTFDTIIRSESADLAVADGVIAAREEPGVLGDDAHEVIDARGLDILPGLIDAHVHFNDPGRAAWEGWGSGTRALAAGGFTCGVDMPLNSDPPTIDARAFEAKLAAARGSAHVDFAFWGGLVPGSIEHMDELAACGVVGFKAFMADSGIDDFPACDDLTLYEGMCRAAVLGLPVAVHAESAVIVRELGLRALAAGRTGDGRLRRLAARRRRGRRRSPTRSRSQAKPVAPCTSSTSRAGGPQCSWPRPARPGPT